MSLRTVLNDGVQAGRETVDLRLAVTVSTLARRILRTRLPSRLVLVSFAGFSNISRMRAPNRSAYLTCAIVYAL